HQLLMNFCVNARDAMPDGGRLCLSAENVHLSEVDRRVHPDAKPGRYVVLTVADTGTGIPPEVVDRIFDPFFTTKEYGKGAGVGLATVQGIVKSHGGFIRVETEINRGTRMIVYLPAGPGSVEEGKKAPVQPQPGASAQTVLLVDDEAHVRDTVSRHLQ